MLASQQELGHWLRLTLTPGIGNETARRLLSAFGPPENIWHQPLAELRQVVSAAQSLALQREPEGWATLLEATWQWLQDKPTERAIVTLGDSDYPAALLDTADPPLLLYAMGRTAHLRQLQAHHAIAMVGSRNPTPQGSVNAREFARSMAACGLTVVSGMALGIDGAAHEGAPVSYTHLRAHETG
jgi:DNA processing protein